MSDVISRGSCPGGADCLDPDAHAADAARAAAGAIRSAEAAAGLTGEELCPRIDALDVDEARAALRYLALGLGGQPAPVHAGELLRAIRHGETWHQRP